MNAENPVSTGKSLEGALTAARRAVADYEEWGARHTALYLATKALIEAVGGSSNEQA